MKALYPKQGDVLARQWQDEGISHTLAVCALRPHPYARWKSAGMKAHMAWRTRTRQALEIACKSAGITPYMSGRLGVCVGAGARRSAPLAARRTQSGEVDHRTESSIMDWDADNLLKAILDASNEILFKDDRQIRLTGPCSFYDDQSDFFSIFLWGEGKDGLSLWKSEWDKEEISGPTRAEWLVQKE